ncbi:hypothetical protein DH2020_007076 [Rehmannia glutinosa]|uniref:Protein kinase domain-containing protein n=1 Tax=Rehmannia glutinosa TaxID=99300 RepID=A0ABR0TXQ5_REHGL
MATGTDDLLSHMNSLALTEMEWDVGNQVDTSAAIKQDWQHHNFQGMEMDNSLRSEGGISSLLARRKVGVQDQFRQFGSFLQNDLSNAMTQSSVVGSSCVTSTLINSTSAPMISSTTYSSQPQTGGAHLGTEPAGEAEVKVDVVQPPYSLPKHDGGVLSHQSVVTSQPISSNAAMPMEVNQSSGPSKEPQSSSPQDHNIPKDSCHDENNSVKGNATDLENSKSEKLDRGGSGKAASTSRRKGFDPDLFFKVNGKLYQRLGKIGSGGSSEVHKVISSDCTIYALKKIKLKGRDYATAYGFCQEIEYLNRLKGKNNIIQLIDYEVTDKILLQEVLNGSMSIKDGRVKDDGYIYMQILLAVNTIHEERIVHSDLKPANFLLVGTLSYMSPEAFMCNETDANGNMIKCGRPSDIWSLGCILYQMVYGRTPFSEYKTFWAKFKVITDPNHEIIYEPVSNPWLLDLMKKCLAWDRNERWRIPQLLQHPFLVPPVPPKLLSPPDQNRTLFQLIAESSADNQKALMLCSQLQSMVMDLKSEAESDSSISREQFRKLLCKISNVCFQLQDELASA